MNNDGVAVLRLMRLASPALPVGAYAYSQGMESAVDAGYVHDRDTAAVWIAGLLEHMLVPVDLAALWRMAQAINANDEGRFRVWNQWLLASRETYELHFEDVQMGAALWRIMENLGLSGDARPPEGGLSFAGAFALAGKHWHIGPEWLLLGYGWSWLENQVAAATKIVPLGQSAAQWILETLHPQVALQVQRAQQLQDGDMGAGLPGLAHLSATHETLYTRLFRS